MENADEGDLLKKITERKQMKVFFRESQVWRILIETVHGLKAMHDLDIMHRDIKSANIFLCCPKSKKDSLKPNPNGKISSSEISCDMERGQFLYQAKLGDMNVSKVTTKGMNSTQTGTPYYASPEVWRDESYSLQSDIWSLGCVIYEMLALKPPFSGSDMNQLYRRV